MEFNFDAYMKKNPLLKETDGYGTYKQPMLEDDDSDSDFEKLRSGLVAISEKYPDSEATYNLIDLVDDEEDQVMYVEMPTPRDFSRMGKKRSDALKDIKDLIKKLGGWKITDIERDGGGLNFTISK